ncbi:hypothetical protein [Anaerotignum sp.]
MMQFLDLAVLLPIIAALTVITNILVEVLKTVTYKKIPTQFLAVIIAQVLTFTVYSAYITINMLPAVWYFHIAAFVVGMMVAYAAMFGFDTLKNALEGRDKDGN